MQMVKKVWCLSALLYQFIEMELQAKRSSINTYFLVIPTALHETCEKESLYAVNPEVVEVLSMISTFL